MDTFWGKVKTLNKRGRKLGFPTINISLHKNIAEGIYFSKVKIKNQIYFALTFIGKVKTFDENNFHSETYILDFNKDIYGEWVSVKLMKKLRNNKKFASEQELIEQMKDDENKAREYFSNCLL